MSHLYQRVPIKCPYNHARVYLEQTLQTAVASGEPQVVRLRLPIPIAASPSESIEKDVMVSYGAGIDPLRFDQPWTVHWTPKNGGPYPDFDGTLTVRADENYNASILELQGDYTPPLGAVGSVFDAVAGSRIASASARGFLREVVKHIESRYVAEEVAALGDGLFDRGQ